MRGETIYVKYNSNLKMWNFKTKIIYNICILYINSVKWTSEKYIRFTKGDSERFLNGFTCIYDAKGLRIHVCLKTFHAELILNKQLSIHSHYRAIEH